MTYFYVLRFQISQVEQLNKDKNTKKNKRHQWHFSGKILYLLITSWNIKNV